jgi:transposase InsO family protein
VDVDLRDQIVDFVRQWSEKTELAAKRLIGWIGMGQSRFYDWKQRYGKVNEHNAWIPRDHWLEDWEKQEIVDYYRKHPDDGYRRVSYMMMDEDKVAASPSSVYRALVEADALRRWARTPSGKGKGFTQPSEPHEHWHIDISYVNVCGTFYYLCSILDGCSRYIVHHEIREQMKETDVEIIVQRATEKFPGRRPRVISDNGPQFIARDFKQFLKLKGMDQVRTAPFYPQSNGKLERWHQSLKSECIRPKTPLSLEDARRIVVDFVEHYNTRRLHSAIGYLTPLDRLEGRHEQIHADRERKLAQARERRRLRRQQTTEEEALAVPA